MGEACRVSTARYYCTSKSSSRTAQGVRNKAENINLRTLKEHQTCVTEAGSPPIVPPEMGKLAVMVGQFPGI